MTLKSLVGSVVGYRWGAAFFTAPPPALLPGGIFLAKFLWKNCSSGELLIAAVIVVDTEPRCRYRPCWDGGGLHCRAATLTEVWPFRALATTLECWARY